MNWAGGIIQKFVGEDDSVLDLGCESMQAILDWMPTYAKTRLQCKHLTGVDLYDPYLEFVKSKGIKTVKHDLRSIPYPFADKSFDAVTALDVIEHLTEEEASIMLKEMERIARKAIIILTPAVFETNDLPDTLGSMCNRELQLHKWLVSKAWLRKRGYTVTTYNINSQKPMFAVKLLKCYPKVKMKGYYIYYLEIAFIYSLLIKKLLGRFKKTCDKMVAHEQGIRLMRILHVWDQAGVAACMAKYQRRLGYAVNVIKLGNWDGKGIDEYYGVHLTFGQKKTASYLAAKKHLPKNKSLRTLFYMIWKLFPTLRLYFYVMRVAKNYDVIHIHGVWSAFFFIPFGKPAIIEFHGDDIRRKPSLYNWFHRMLVRSFVFLYSLNHKVYVSTPDLLSEVRNSVWIPNPVDTEHFVSKSTRNVGTALCSTAWFDRSDFAGEYARAHGLKLTVLNRKSQSWIDYREFPDFLGSFEYYIDRRDIHSLSKTALEALYMGLKVVDWTGHVRQGFPAEHKPECVANNTLKIYEEVIAS